MDCSTARECIVESWTDVLPPEISGAFAAHCAECEACAAIARQQQALDTRLTRLLVPGEIGPGFRRRVIRHAIESPQHNWRELLPELVHFITWGVGTAACALVLPVSTSHTFAAGVGIAVISYFVLVIVRTSFEPLPR